MHCQDCQQPFEDPTIEVAGVMGMALGGRARDLEGNSYADGSAENKEGDPAAETGSERREVLLGAHQTKAARSAQLPRVPLILVDCGHTICQACLCNRFEQVVLNAGGTWDQVSRLTCNKCPECPAKIINKEIFDRLNGKAPWDQARIIATVQACYPVNKALLNLRKTIAASEPRDLGQSPDVRKKRTMWPALELQDEENEPQINMIFDPERGQMLGAGTGKYLDDHEYVDDADDVDPDYHRIQHDFHHMQEEVHKEMQLFESRQKKITYLTQQSQDDNEDDGENASSEEEEESEQEDVPEEGQTDLGRSADSQERRRARQQQLRALEGSPRGSKQESATGKSRRRENQKCRAHPKKKIQAFCGDCQKVMCINCILDPAHKGHEMININVAADAQRQSFNDGLKVAKASQTELESQILTIRNHISELEINAQAQREKIGRIFSEIRQKIMVREQLLKKRLSEMLETEQTLYKQRIENLKDQIRCIKDLEIEQAKVRTESDLMILQRCKLRGEILADAKKEVQGQPLMNCIPKIRKEEELACVVNIILPKKFRAQLLSNKLSHQFRKIWSLESSRRHELLKQKRDLRITLDGSAGSGSQSFLAAGSLLSFPSGRFPQSNSNARGRQSKDRVARVHKVELHQRLNSQQNAIQFKKLDNSQGQKSRNEGAHPPGAAEPVAIHNMSPRQAAQPRLLQAQLKLHRSRERTSPGVSHAVAINLVSSAGLSGTGPQENAESNRNSRSFDNFWSLSNMRIQNHIMRLSMGQKRAVNAQGTGGSTSGKQLRTKRAHAQMAGLSVLRRQQQKESQDTARRGQNVAGSRHNGSGLVVVPHLNMTLDQNPMTQRAAGSNEKNDEIESMKTQKRGMSPMGPNIGLGSTMENLGLAGNLSLLNIQSNGGPAANAEDLQKFKQNNKTIERIEVAKQQLSMDLEERSLLQKIDESEEARKQPAYNLVDLLKDKKVAQAKKGQTQQTTSAATHQGPTARSTQRGKKGRDSERKIDQKSKNMNALAHGQVSNPANGADFAKTRPKIRKFTHINYQLGPALTDRNNKIGNELSGLSTYKKTFNNQDLVKILKDTVKPSGQRRRNDSARSEAQSPASHTSPSEPQALISIDKLIKPRLLHQSRGYSQGRSKKKKSKRDKVAHTKNSNLRACPSSQIHLKPSNEQLIGSAPRSNHEKTSDDQVRSLSKTRKQWKDRDSQMQERLSVDDKDKPAQRFGQGEVTAQPHQEIGLGVQASPEEPKASSKPIMIQETYYKKQMEDHEEEEREVGASGYETVDRLTDRRAAEYGARSPRSSTSGGPQESRSRASLHAGQRKQWAKKNSMQQRVSDSILQPRGQTLKPSQKESPMSSKTCEQDLAETHSNQHDSQVLHSRLETQHPLTRVESSKASLYELILHQNQGGKQLNRQTHHNQPQQPTAVRRKPIQSSQTATYAWKMPKKTKSSLSKNLKAEANADRSGSLQNGIGSQTAGAATHSLTMNASSQLYQPTTYAQSAFQQAQVGSAASVRQPSATTASNVQRSSPQQTQMPPKSLSKTKIVRSNKQISSASALKLLQSKKKRMAKHKKDVRNVLHDVNNESRTEVTEPATYDDTKQHSDLSHQKQVEQLKGEEDKCLTTRLPGRIGKVADARVGDRLEERVHQGSRRRRDDGGHVELANEGLGGPQQVSKAQLSSSDQETYSEEEEDASVDEAQMEVNSDRKLSPHRRQLEDPSRRLRSGEAQHEKHKMTQLYTATAKCKSPEPIQQIERLRRFDLTTPKKMLRGLDQARDHLMEGVNKAISHAKVESQKLGKIGVNNEKDLIDDFEELEEDERQNATRSIHRQTLPLESSMVHLIDRSLQNGQQISGFEAKVRSRSSQGQSTFNRAYSSAQKRKQTEQMTEAREQVELPAAARSISRYSSCDFQVDDDERIDDQYYRKNPQDSELQTGDLLDRSGVAVQQRRAKMSINQSSYSVALMQSKKNQKKKVNYESKLPMVQAALLQKDPHGQPLAPKQTEGTEAERASCAAGQQMIKKSIQKKVIRELGLCRERPDQVKHELTSQGLIHGPHSNRSIGKPILKLAEPTRAQSPLSVNSNISSSHSSKYQSVKIAPKHFRSTVRATPKGRIDHLVSPEMRQKGKKSTVKSFLHGSATLSQASEQRLMPSGLDLEESHRMLATVSRSPSAKYPGQLEADDQRARAFVHSRPPQHSQSSFHTNPVAAAIAQVTLHGHSGGGSLPVEQLPFLRQLEKLNGSRASEHGAVAETQPKPAMDSSGKKRSKKIREFESIPTVQARSHTSLHNDATPPGRLFDGLASPSGDMPSAVTSALPEALCASAGAADFAVSNASSYVHGLALNQSKSELYRVKEEFLFIFGGIGEPKNKHHQKSLSRDETGLTSSSIQQPESVEVMDVFREICREFKGNENVLDLGDSQRKEDEAPQKILGNEGTDCFPIHGFQAIQFKLDPAQVKGKKITKFGDRIYLIGGQDALGNILDQVHEYSVNDMHTLFKADWRLPCNLTDFAIAQGSVRRSDLSESIFIAGGVANSQKNQRAASGQVHRISMDKAEANTSSKVLGTDMTTGLQFKCEDLPSMLVPRSQFSLVFRSLNQHEFELFAIGGVDEGLQAYAGSSLAIERYSSRTKSWEFVDLKVSLNQESNEHGRPCLVDYVRSLRGHQSVLLPDGSILIIGGKLPASFPTKDAQMTERALSYQSSVVRFDLQTSTLSSNELPPMNQARGFFTAVLTQSLRYIYVIGGLTDRPASQTQQNKGADIRDRKTQIELNRQSTKTDVAIGSIEKFDTFSQKWQLVAPMKSKRGRHAMCQMFM